MKKKIFTLCFVLLSFVSVFAQENILLDDFESGEVTFTTEVHVNPPAHMDQAVVDNPFKSGINTSNKVWEWARYDAGTDNKSWAGFWAALKTEIPSGYNRIEIKYLRTKATSQLRINCEGAVRKEFLAKTPASKTNEWETMVFDLTENGIKNIKVLGLQPDFYEPIDPNAISYIDDIVVIYDPAVEPPPVPTSMILFDNSATERYYDPSWSTKTAPSTLVQENWEGPDMANGDKLPVVTSPVKAGSNALKLQWKSVESGTWRAIVASMGWQLFDVRTMETLNFWINSPVALAKSALPYFFFESAGSTPNQSGKLPLANYLNTDLAANTWTEVIIPLHDVWVVNPDFVLQEFVKGIFFEQNVADNVEHTLYLDEFTFMSTTGINTQIVKNMISAFYSNGQLRILNYTGNVKVFDVLGRKVAEGRAIDGNFPVSLNNGVYIVNTTKGNTKIMLQ